MASYYLLNRAIASYSAGMPAEELREKLLEEDEGEYNAWLAFVAAQVSMDFEEAFFHGFYSLEDYRKSRFYEEEENNKHELDKRNDKKIFC